MVCSLPHLPNQETVYGMLTSPTQSGHGIWYVYFTYPIRTRYMVCLLHLSNQDTVYGMFTSHTQSGNGVWYVYFTYPIMTRYMVCLLHLPNQDTVYGMFTSPIQSGHGILDDDRILYATFSEGDTSASGSVVCRFNLDEIDENFDTGLYYSFTGDDQKGWVAESRKSPTTCATKAESEIDYYVSTSTLSNR